VHRNQIQDWTKRLVETAGNIFTRCGHSGHSKNRAAYEHSRKDHKKVEMLFAHLERILKLDRLGLRGMSGARDELLLAAIAQNLRRMAKLFSQPPPTQGALRLLEAKPRRLTTVTHHLARDDGEKQENNCLPQREGCDQPCLTKRFSTE